MTSFVSCCDEKDQENVVELPTEEDGRLTIKTLSSAFDGARGLKYQNPKTGAWRIVALDDEGVCLKPPLGGWEDTKFIVISNKEDKAKAVKRVAEVVNPVFPGSGPVNKASRYDYYGSIGYGDISVAPRDDPNHADRTRDLIITGLPYTATEKDITDALESYGEIEYVEHKVDHATNAKKGYGFVRFKSIDAQKAVLDRVDFTITGRLCQVKIPIDRNSYQSPQLSSVPQYTRKLFIGRIGKDTTEAQLHAAFDREAKLMSPDGQVTDVFLPLPFKGFAFVTFNSPQVAQALLKKKNFYVDGHSVFVNPAVLSAKEQAKQGMPAGAAPGTPGGPPYDYGYGYASGAAPWVADAAPSYAKSMYGDSPYAAAIAQHVRANPRGPTTAVQRVETAPPTTDPYYGYYGYAHTGTSAETYAHYQQPQ